MSVKKYLPSKRFSQFIGIAILIGLVVFVVLKFFGSKYSTRQKIQNIATREIIEELDTDNDGLKDWEEALWGMDIDNPDTDDNGILDGQEVERRREELRGSENFVDVDAVPDTETEKIARQILTIALNVNQTTNGQLDQTQVFEMAEGMIGSIKPELIDIYKMSDLNISSTKSAQSYYDEMTESLGYLNTMPQNELSIVEQAASTNRERVLKDLNPIIEGYSTAAEKVIDKEIPTQVAIDHLDYINALTQKAIAIISMTQYFSDPIIAVRGIEEYRLADQKQIKASNNITQYLKNNGIVR